MYRYTIAVCNYNMSRTLEQSLRSVLDQVTDEFEVLVVDGGSDDGSLDILAQLDDEYDNFRYLVPDPDPERRLGGDRDIAVREARGEYILSHIDTDDVFHTGICDFVTVYHQIEEQLERELMLVGGHITMVRREHLLEMGSYRNLAAAEDIDLWRRAVARSDTEYIWLNVLPFHESIGYDGRAVERIQRMLDVRTAEFRIGISLRSYLRWNIEQHPPWKAAYNMLVTVIAYLRSRRRESYPPIEGMRSKRVSNERLTASVKIDELMEEYDIDLSQISDEAIEYFVGHTTIDEPRVHPNHRASGGVDRQPGRENTDASAGG